MAIPVRNDLVNELLTYLENRAEDDLEADDLYHRLLEDKVEQEKIEMQIDGELPLPDKKTGAYII